MPGVDKMDQMMSTYDPTRKRLKRYYRRSYFTLLEMCFYNSFVAYCHLVHPKKVTYLEYKKDVVKRTIDKYGKKFYKTTDGCVLVTKLQEKLGRKRNVLEAYRLHPGQHFPVAIGLDAKGNDLRRECQFCNKQTVKSQKLQDMKRKQRSNVQCELCQHALCVTPCFKLYHTVEDYVNYQKRQNVS